jgi:hypothetical protein
MSSATAHCILREVGFGSKFVNQLTLRTLQRIGFAPGPILLMGTGTHKVANKLCQTKKLDVQLVYKLYLSLVPTIKWIIASTLGETWLALECTFPDVAKKQRVCASQTVAILATTGWRTRCNKLPSQRT